VLPIEDVSASCELWEVSKETRRTENRQIALPLLRHVKVKNSIIESTAGITGAPILNGEQDVFVSKVSEYIHFSVRAGGAEIEAGSKSRDVLQMVPYFEHACGRFDTAHFPCASRKIK